jgi:hypothetical protein
MNDSRTRLVLPSPSGRGDELAEKARLVKGCEGCLDGHDGPYYVDLEADDLKAFFRAMGVDSIGKLADAHIVRLRAASESMPEHPGLRS